MDNKSKQAYLLLSDTIFICFYFSVIQELESSNNEDIPELKSSDFTLTRGGRTTEKWIRQIILSEERKSKFYINGLNKRDINFKDKLRYHFRLICLIQSVNWLRINYSHYLKAKLSRRELRN